MGKRLTASLLVSGMKVRDVLQRGERLIEALGSDEARLEAELLLGKALRLDRVQLYQRLDDELTASQQQAYHRLLNRRLEHEPAAYILGHKEFFGLEFDVSPAAIIPRPETETLVELAIAFARERFAGSPLTVVDVGTGCGAIAVSLVRSLPQAQIIAIDVSPEALVLAARNAERDRVSRERISFLRGDLLDPLGEPVDVIAANLPYVPMADCGALPPEIRDHEPRGGLDGGADGLRLINLLLRQAPRHFRPGGGLFVEIGDEQARAAIEIARAAFPHGVIDVKHDLAGRDRVLVVHA